MKMLIKQVVKKANGFLKKERDFRKNGNFESAEFWSWQFCKLMASAIKQNMNIVMVDSPNGYIVKAA